MKGLIILNGNIKDLNLLKEAAEESDFILAADGGIRYIVEIGLVPDLVIGDFDSISKKYLDLIRNKDISIEQFPVKKDKTDSELCVDYMIDQGAKHIILFGAIGSRIDHTLANIYLLDKIVKAGISGEIIDSSNRITLVTDELKLTRKLDHFTSIIPLTFDGAIVTLKGFEYNLTKVNIDFASTQGVSNRIVEEEGYIKIHQGKCLVTISKD